MRDTEDRPKGGTQCKDSGERYMGEILRRVSDTVPYSHKQVSQRGRIDNKLNRDMETGHTDNSGIEHSDVTHRLSFLGGFSDNLYTIYSIHIKRPRLK